MYFLLFLSTLYINIAAETCINPSGQSGECVPIRSCPSMMWSLANVKYGMDSYLERHVCSNDEFGLKVCCYETSDRLLFENEEYSSGLSKLFDIQLSNSRECGITDNPVVRNGIIRLQDFPWLVKIVSIANQGKTDVERRVVCTGVLITELYVLFSAQCFHYLQQNGAYYVHVESYKPREENCGATSYSTNCSYSEIYEVHHKVHPFYDQETKLNDIAIIRLNKRVQESDYLRPICLPLSDTLQVGQTLHRASWNRTFDVDDISVKKIQPSVVISNADCLKRMSESGNNISLTAYEMCTETKESIFDRYDFGLPLMSLRGNQWYIEGFESQGDNIKVNTRIHSYLQWIQKRMGLERCLTPYNEIGESTELGFCPRLLDAIANSHRNDTKSLLNFAHRWNNENVNSNTYIFKVCCGIKPNFTLPPETRDNKVDSQVSEFQYCGLQHRDEYFSSSDSISIDEFPWLAIIMNATLVKQRTSICAGTLINPRYVLTSGHCIDLLNSFDNILVRLGDYNLRNSSDCIKNAELDSLDCSSIQEYRVEKRIFHPFYNYFAYINNIALLRLSGKVTFSDYIRPICLPRSEKDIGVPGDLLLSTGFGDSNVELAGPKIKKKIRMSLISFEECADRTRLSSAILPITAYHTCTEEWKNSTDILCRGDEGSPIMISKRSRWFVVGVSSRYTCGGTTLQVHLNIYKYMKWIKLNIE